MKKISKIDPVSLAKMQAVIGIIAGVIIGALMTLASLLGSGSIQGAGVAAGLGIFAIIAIPVIYGIGGFIGGLIFGWLYNLASKWIGGVRIELSEDATLMSSDSSEQI